MEWRIIVPVLCLIGILHVPGNAAQANSTNSTSNTTIVYRFSLRFSINALFLSEYSNNTSSATIDLKNNITFQVKPLYQGKYPNFVGFNILKFSNGSIVTEGELQFSNGSKPNATDLVQILNNGTFNFTIVANSTNAVEVTEPAATTPATTTTAPPPAKVAQISLVFKLTQTFKDIYSNLSNPETIELTNNITTECSRVYKSRFPNFYRMVILKFSNGSIVTDSVLEFNTTNSATPNATDVKNTLIAAIASGNFSLKVDNTSISATAISETTTTPATTTTTAPAPAKIGKISLVFKLTQTFKDIYSNLSNPETIVLTNNITTECSRVYKSRFPQFYRMVILKFSNGSIVTDSVLEFNTTTTAIPNATDVKNTLITAIANGNFSFAIDNSSIIATAISDTASRSPFLASMLTAVWMTLASLLLSAVMH